MTKPKLWLSRSSTSGSSRSISITPQAAPVKAPKPIRISEPQFNNSLGIFNVPRNGALGSGATVVRTPQEALSVSTSQLYDLLDEEEEEVSKELEKRDLGRNGSITGKEYRDLPSPPSSPPLPAVPTSKSSPNLPLRETLTPPRPMRPAPPVPAASASTTLRPSLKPRTPPSSEYSPPVPALPSNIPTSPLQPPFQAILLSSVPASAIDPSKIIVTLETSTTSHRTTLNTLTSRPSYLSSYIASLFPSPNSPDTASLYSNTSNVSNDQDSSFNSIFHNHLTSSGVLPNCSSNLHIFLDRPSAPYAHILTYLRSPPSTPENPATLPRAAQLSSCSSSRLEALLELRDEACYLDLDELYRLCTEEIRQRQSLVLHARGGSNSSHNGSMRSIRTFRECMDPSEQKASYRDSSDTMRSGSTSVTELGFNSNSPHVPRQQSTARGRSHSRKGSPIPASMRSRPPVGWI
ncbi:hypothetical protein SERLA73DRAFT_120556 [Serpula lacrymans var. lacrymans S7.3]|uniref:BTB domain-containing protein n=2 Tax=Serpula lacrymans var. lacrymans TaxID=341189 RepID=F8PP30_SERL3|nr:hypothetical protein SERLA73DRAFT_120556 [Serpula lacrymans var. lacrymans S7.3]